MSIHIVLSFRRLHSGQAEKRECKQKPSASWAFAISEHSKRTTFGFARSEAGGLNPEAGGQIPETGNLRSGTGHSIRLHFSSASGYQRNCLKLAHLPYSHEYLAFELRNFCASVNNNRTHFRYLLEPIWGIGTQK